MVNEFDEWDLKLAEWRGYTLKALEGINEEIKEIKSDIKDIKTRNNKRDIRTAEIAGSLSILIMVIGYVLQNVVKI